MERKCLHCGVDISGLRLSAKFCTPSHRVQYFNRQKRYKKKELEQSQQQEIALLQRKDEKRDGFMFTVAVMSIAIAAAMFFAYLFADSIFGKYQEHNSELQRLRKCCEVEKN